MYTHIRARQKWLLQPERSFDCGMQFSLIVMLCLQQPQTSFLDDDRLFLFLSTFLTHLTPLSANLHPLPLQQIISTPQIRARVSHFDINPPTVLRSTSCRSRRCINKSGAVFCIAAALCVACHCVMLTLYMPSLCPFLCILLAKPRPVVFFLFCKMV